MGRHPKGMCLTQAEDFAAAAALAFELRQARRLLAVVNAALERGPSAAAEILGALVARLDGPQVKQCLSSAANGTCAYL